VHLKYGQKLILLLSAALGCLSVLKLYHTRPIEMETREEHPTHPPIINKWVDDNPEVFTGLLDIALLVASMSLIITRISLGKLKESLQTTIKFLKVQPKDAYKYTLDPTSELKKEVLYHVNKILNSTTAKWCALGVLSNGEVSEFGYHFCNLNWDYTVNEPNTLLPLKHLQNLNPTEVSVKLYNNKVSGCFADTKQITKQIQGYHTVLYGLHLGNILMGVVSLGYMEEPLEELPKSLIKNIKSLEYTLSSNVSKPSKP